MDKLIVEIKASCNGGVFSDKINFFDCINIDEKIMKSWEKSINLLIKYPGSFKEKK